MYNAHWYFGAPFASCLLKLSRVRVYFARLTIAIAKIRDYSQSIFIITLIDNDAFTIEINKIYI